MLYGKNGTGKSNFTYALMDITLHLTDFSKQEKHYVLYRNLNSSLAYAEFCYEFQFGANEVIYKYKKESMSEVFDEVLLINGEEIIYEDFSENKRFVKLKGAETLNVNTREEKTLSFVKYIFNNTTLDANDEKNKIFIMFREFVEGMLYFGSGTGEGTFYQGFKSTIASIPSVIVDTGNLGKLEEFLKGMEINYNLEAGENDEGKSIIIVKFKDKKVNILAVASHGTKVLLVFFYWLLQLNKIKFLVVDEFDAFYHNEVSEKLLLEVRESSVQSLFTTHNTTIMSNDLLRPDNYFVIQNNQIKTLVSLTDKELRFAHNLEKMYNAGKFNEEK